MMVWSLIKGQLLARKDTIIKLLKLGLSVFLVILLLSRIDTEEILKVVSSTNIYLFCLAISLGIGGNVVSSYKWQLLLCAQDIKVPLAKLVSFYFVGGFFNNFIPSSIGGDVVKTYDLAKYSNKTADSVASVFMDRFTGLLALVTIAMVAAASNIKRFSDGLIMVMVFGLGLLVIGVFLVMFNGSLFRKIDSLLQFLGLFGVQGKARRIYGPINAYKAQKKLFAEALAISFVFQFIAIMISYLLFLSVSVSISPFYVFVLVPVVSIISMLPISVNGIGLQDGAYVFLFAQAGIAAPAALSVSLLFHTLRLLISLIGGVIYAARK